MLRVLVVCGSTRGRQGFIPPILRNVFLELLLRINPPSMSRVVIHDDSPLVGEDSAEQFCVVRSWELIRKMFASAEDGMVDAVIILEHTESGAVAAQLADTLARVREGSRPPFNAVFVADRQANLEDGRVAWGPEFPRVCFHIFDDRLADESFDRMMDDVIAELAAPIEEEDATPAS